jgi:hypothetical protein
LIFVAIKTKVKYGRVFGVALLVELAAILLLVVVVALSGQDSRAEAEEFATRVGMWLGPAAGFVFCILGGWFVARKLTSHWLVHGFLLGLFVAVIDIALLISGGSAFQTIFVVSNIGRIVAGTLGGWLASRSVTT